MTVIINNLITLERVKEFSVGKCEITLSFNENHLYSSIEELDSHLNKAGISVGNYHFNGTDCYGNHYGNDTDILCVIPQNLRDDLKVIVKE